MISNTEYRIFPLGDAALTIDFGNVIDPSLNKKVLSLFSHLRENPLPCMVEAVPAYSSLTVYYDVLSLRKMAEGTVLYNHMKALVQERIESVKEKINEGQSRVLQIPVSEPWKKSQHINAISSRSVNLDNII